MQVAVSEESKTARWPHLLGPVSSQGFGRVEALLLGLYALVVSCTVPRHELWADEAQAWMLAQSCSLREILTRRLHYEGAPALWQMIVVPLARLHLPPASMNWFAALAGTVSTYVLLRYAPFPRILRWILPFTFFLQYQYAVIGRPYCLFPLLAFGLAMVYRSTPARPVLFALLAGLAANINLHVLMWSAGLFAVYLWKLYRAAGLPLRLRRQAASSIALFAMLAGLSFAIALPAPDQTQAHYGPRMAALVSRVIPPEHVPPGVQRTAAVHYADPPPSDRWFYRGRIGSAVRPVVRGARPVLGNVLRAAGLPLYSISGSNLIGAAFLGLFVVWLKRRGALLQIVPLVLLDVVYGIVWGWDHHAGIFFVGVIVATWIALENTPSEPNENASLQPLFLGLFVLVSILQVRWALSADLRDRREPYDAAGQTAAFLQQHHPGARLAVFGYDALPLELYMPKGSFRNWPREYWPWTDALDPDRRVPEAAQQHPDVVVIGAYLVGPQFISDQIYHSLATGRMGDRDTQDLWEARGWRSTHRFCGNHFGHGSVAQQNCYDIYEPPAGGRR